MIWKDIKDYEGLYQVSNTGLIKNIKSNRILSLAIRKDGYIGVTLTVRARNPIKKSFLIHRLIAQSFIPNPENKDDINHINGIKSDNRIENLEWCTQKENVRHYIKIGLRPKHPTAKLSKNDVEDILQLDKMYGLKTIVIAKEYDIGISAITKIKNNTRWTNVIRP